MIDTLQSVAAELAVTPQELRQQADDEGVLDSATQAAYQRAIAQPGTVIAFVNDKGQHCAMKCVPLPRKLV